MTLKRGPTLLFEARTSPKPVKPKGVDGKIGPTFHRQIGQHQPDRCRELETGSAKSASDKYILVLWMLINDEFVVWTVGIHADVHCQ